MDDDIYNKLIKQGFLKREVDYRKNKLIKDEKKKKKKILNKVLYRNYILEDEDKFTPDVISLKEEKYLNIENMIEKKNNNHILYLKNKFEIELKDYEYIDSENINKIKLGGYVRCVDLDENIKWGGTVINLLNKKNLSKFKIKIINSKKDIWSIKYSKYYVFFKKTVTYRDTFKDIFIKKANLQF